MADLDLSAQFSVLARGGMPPSTLLSWEPTLWREPRVLVPVDVQALVVAAPGAETWADVARRLPESPEPAAGSAPQPDALAAPPPFTALAERPRGVYLHWALPDALARSTVPHEPGAASGPVQLGLPPVPNRWLVARIGGGVPRRVSAWVVEADRGATTRLADWREQAQPPAGARTPWLEPEQLTAVTGGDAAWAAVVDGVVDRFAVYDDLAGLHANDAAATVSYLVAGWYSEAALDPLAGADAAGGFEALMDRLRWHVEPKALLRARRAADAARAAAAAVRKPTAPRAAAGDVVGRLKVGAVEARVPVPTSSQKRLVEKGSLTIAPTAWSPRQLLCHGVVHGVRPDGGGADARPRPQDVALALGSSSEESFAALLAAALPDPRGGERLAAAFLRGMAGRYDDADGAIAVDEDLHGSEFVSLPGGTRTQGDRVRVSGPADGLLDALGRNAARRVPGRRLTGVKSADDGAVQRGEDVLEVFESKRARADSGRTGAGPTKGDAAAAGRSAAPGAPEYRDVEVGLPRMHAPSDPVLTLTGAGRSLRHGGDGRLTADGKLACRLTAEPTDAMYAVLPAGAVVAPLGHGSLPPECDALLAEAALADGHHADETAARAAEAVTTGKAAMTARVRGEIALAAAASQNLAVNWAAAGSTMDGTFSSGVATTWWRQPWVPLYVEWEIALDLPDDDAAALATWQLAEVDLEPADGPAPGTTTRSTLTGRSLIAPGPAAAFADGVEKALDAERERDAARTGELEPATELALRELARRSGGLDVTAAAFDTLRSWLLGWDDNVARVRRDAAAEAPLPARLPRLLRSGAFTLVRARVVDAFGRTLDLTPRLADLRIATSLTADGKGASGPDGTFVPRITAPGRLMLRLVEPGREAVEAYVDQEAGGASPLAGWLLPDTVDHAVEIFDAAGEPLGQLLHDTDGPGVLWESAPGLPGPLGAPPPVRGPGDAPLAALVTGLLRSDVQRRLDNPPPETEDLLEEEESPLSALLRVLDTTAATTDTGAAGTEHVAGLVGRPLALIRALLRIDAGPDPAPAETPEPLRSERAQALRELARLAVPVRLGALSRLNDGLLGFFVDDDYTRLYPVAGDVLTAALDSGPRRGVLATGADPAAAQIRPVTSPYVAADPVLPVHPGQTQRLTLLVLPGTAVHATCGVLPRTSVRLQREWTAEALERIAPSFRIGPVLVDPASVRLPAPGSGGMSPTWAYRDTPGTWRNDPIAAASAEARLAERAAQVQEGWIRLRLAREEDA